MMVTRWNSNDSFEDRFNRSVIKKESGCWDWSGCLYATGYGKITFQTKNWLAHRASYKIHKGDVPSDMLVCHTCDNRKCTNPDHLFIGTHKDNLSDMKNKGRSNRGQKNGRSKLTDEDVGSLKHMNRVRYFEQKELAKHFGINRSLVSMILGEKVWQHVK